MDEEFKKRLCDYFTPSELLDVLDVPIASLVDLLEEYIEEQQEELNEYITYGK